MVVNPQLLPNATRPSLRRQNPQKTPSLHHIAIHQRTNNPTSVCSLFPVLSLPGLFRPDQSRHLRALLDRIQHTSICLDNGRVLGSALMHDIGPGPSRGAREWRRLRSSWPILVSTVQLIYPRPLPYLLDLHFC